MRRRHFTSTPTAFQTRSNRNRCPKCGRGNAIMRATDEAGISRGCRWCDYGSFRSWEDIYDEADARRRDAKA